ncbi:MAG TPA: N-acetyltransferase [Rhizomicrobium sp.]|jgi:predicted N-acetyltransferase YhbS|nr:N-acetyltransferase [Rhizomicrobium sp.]
MKEEDGKDGSPRMWEIRPEEPRDAPHIEALVAKSFGPGRHAKSAWRLREGVHAVEGLRFVAVEGDRFRGSVRFWPVAIGNESALLLGPLAVDAELRGQGIGLALMLRGIEDARARGHRAIILVGDAPYYARAGFAPLPERQVRFPGPVDGARILGLALVPGAVETLRGEVRRARIDEPVCADGAPLATREFLKHQTAGEQTIE